MGPNARRTADGSVDDRLTRSVATLWAGWSKLRGQQTDHVRFFDVQESASVATAGVLYGEYYFLVADSRKVPTAGTLEAILGRLLGRSDPSDATAFETRVRMERRDGWTPSETVRQVLESLFARGPSHPSPQGAVVQTQAGTKRRRTVSPTTRQQPSRRDAEATRGTNRVTAGASVADGQPERPTATRSPEGQAAATVVQTQGGTKRRRTVGPTTSQQPSRQDAEATRGTNHPMAATDAGLVDAPTATTEGGAATHTHTNAEGSIDALWPKGSSAASSLSVSGESGTGWSRESSAELSESSRPDATSDTSVTSVGSVPLPDAAALSRASSASSFPPPGRPAEPEPEPIVSTRERPIDGYATTRSTAQGTLILDHAGSTGPQDRRFDAPRAAAFGDAPTQPQGRNVPLSVKRVHVDEQPLPVENREQPQDTPRRPVAVKAAAPVAKTAGTLVLDRTEATGPQDRRFDAPRAESGDAPAQPQGRNVPLSVKRVPVAETVLLGPRLSLEDSDEDTPGPFRRTTKHREDTTTPVTRDQNRRLDRPRVSMKRIHLTETPLPGPVSSDDSDEHVQGDPKRASKKIPGTFTARIWTGQTETDERNGWSDWSLPRFGTQRNGS